DLLDECTLFGFRLAREQGRVVVAVPHPFPAEVPALFDDARIARAHIGVERDRAFDAIALHHFHHPPDADAHAVVAPRIVEHVGWSAGSKAGRTENARYWVSPGRRCGRRSAMTSADGR